VAQRLRESRLAHADLQHGNIILVPGRTTSSLAVKLIDYDGMFVPALAGSKSGEVGHPSYQHPQRLREGIYSAEVDRFPWLLTACALRSLRVAGRGLWEKYDNGDNLLFREEDLRRPAESAVFRELWQISDAAVHDLVGHLTLAAVGPLERVPTLDQLLIDGAILPLSAPQEDQVTALLGPGARVVRRPIQVQSIPLPPADVPEEMPLAFDLSPRTPRVRRSATRSRRTPSLLTLGLVAAVALIPLLGVAAALAVFLTAGLHESTGRVEKTVAQHEVPAMPPETPNPKPADSSRVDPVRLPDAEPKREPKTEPPADPPEPTVPRRPPDVPPAGENKPVVAANKPPAAEMKPPAAEAKPPAPTVKPPVVEPKTPPHLFAGHTDKVTGVAFLPDGKRVLSGGVDRMLRLWDMQTGEEEHAFELRAPATCVAVEAGGGHIGAGTTAGDFQFWSVDMQTPTSRGGHKNTSVGGVAFAPDEHRLLIGTQTGVTVWEDSRARSYSSALWTRITAVAASPSGNHGLLGFSDGAIRLWNVETGKEEGRFASHGSAVLGVAFSRDGHYAATASADKTARLWDAPNFREVHRFFGHGGPVRSVALAPDARLVATGSEDRTVRVWDARTGRQLHVFTGHTAAVTSVAFSPDGHQVLSGSEDKTVRLWDIPRGAAAP
jgi:hypothetical protein